MVTIKEYAKAHGKSVQAVYQQMKAKENAPLLEGHIITEKVNNKPTKFLDDVAVEILEKASLQSPTIVLQEEQSERLEELQNENKMLLVKVAELQDKLVSKQELITELSGNNLLLIEEKNKQAEQNEKRKERIQELKATNQILSDRLKESDKTNTILTGLLIAVAVIAVFVLIWLFLH